MADELFVGVDVGGTSVKIGVVSAEGKIVAKASVPTPPLVDETGYAAVTDGIQGLLDQNGIDAARIKGIGLANVHTRLRLAYGEGYGLRVESEKGRYTEITVHIPKEYSQRKDEDHDHTGG